MSLTEAPSQVFDVYLLLLHARSLSDQARVVVGVSICGADRVFVVAAAVNVANAPGGRGQPSEQHPRSAQPFHRRIIPSSNAIRSFLSSGDVF